MLTTAPRGTKDILPGEVLAWNYVEKILREVSERFGFKELRTPTFEHTELFKRGIGDATDVVDKEMYTFLDRGERSITLRPENTASAARAYVEHKLYGDGQITKLFYIGSMFRYDRPQAGRLREFHQYGVECLATPGPLADAEVILLALEILNKLGLKDLQLKINSVGCKNCRPAYGEKLREYFKPHLAELCDDCRSRFDRNPLRLLDCKNPKCHEIAQGAPSLGDCLCDDCAEHFALLKQLLDGAGVKYQVDSNLVRGLDYYTKTAFEIQYPPLGAQSAVAGGGRYDGLVEEIGGPATPGIGFAMGLERVMLALEQQKLLPEQVDSCEAYLISMGQSTLTQVFKTAAELRHKDIKVEFDLAGGSMKSQMKKANKAGAKKVLIFGEEELERGCVTVKDMATSEQKEIALENIFNELSEVEK